MRDIKFRARTAGGELYTFNVFDIYGADPDERYFYIDQTSAMLVRDSLERFTGLKDKNGVEIYEGDVFNLDDDMAPAVVEFTNHMDEQASPAAEYCLSLYEHGKRIQRLSMGEFYIERCEVIDNIYENPELLKEAA
jgi:uncharacterized phage protein (TIGR01671 family)